MRAGFAQRDITVFEPGMAMLGWGQFHNQAFGVAEPLRVRAGCFEAGPDGAPHAPGDASATGRLAYASCDLLFVSEAVRRRVLEQLAADPGFGESEVVLAATHTHSGPSGFSHYFWKNLASPGFSQPVYDAIVDGIVGAIRDAWTQRRAARLWLIRDEIPLGEGLAWNRSWRAYNRNRDVDAVTRETRDEATDRTLTLLRVDHVGDTAGTDGSTRSHAPAGVLCWFGLHGTCVHADNHLLHPDHKGLASGQLESSIDGLDVAIFAQEAAGDVSPNFRWCGDRGVAVGRHDDDFESATHVAGVQARWARRLFERAPRDGVELSGPIDTAVRYDDFSSLEVDGRIVPSGAGRWTSPARVGLSMAQGTAEGPGPLRERRWLCSALNGLVGGLDRARARLQPGYTRRHDPKFPLLDVGLGTRARLAGLLPIKRGTLPPVDPVTRYVRRLLSDNALGRVPFMPHRLPGQLVRIGRFAFAATPFELTTVAGRRLRQTLRDTLSGEGIDTVVVNPYCNAYAGYMTTLEEYQAQAYEGGYTLFGPWSLAALRTAFARVAGDLGLPRSARTLGVPPAPVPPVEVERNRFVTPWTSV